MLDTILPTDVSSGIAEMDRLHFDFFAALEELASTPDSQFAEKFGQFVHQAERAFAWEEQCMDDFDFSADKLHREQHARVLGALHHVHARVLEGDLKIGRDTVETLLPQWFAFHIATMDMTLAAMMQMSEIPHVLPASMRAGAACLQ